MRNRFTTQSICPMVAVWRWSAMSDDGDDTKRNEVNNVNKEENLFPIHWCAYRVASVIKTLFFKAQKSRMSSILILCSSYLLATSTYTCAFAWFVILNELMLCFFHPLMHALHHHHHHSVSIDFRLGANLCKNGFLKAKHHTYGSRFKPETTYWFLINFNFLCVVSLKALASSGFFN